MHGHSYSLFHVQNIDSPLLVGMLVKVLFGKKLVVTIHGEKNIVFKKSTILGRWRLALMARLGKRFVALTEACRHQYIQEGITSACIRDIPNGIDTEHFRPALPNQKVSRRQKFGYAAADHLVLYVGRLVDLKRVDLLIETWGDLSYANSSYCIIVGDGPERARLQALVNERGLTDRIRLVGAADDVLDYYQIADIFVLPSLYEGLSVALLEAMACGLCVIVAGSPGNLSVVEHNANGFVFPVDQPQLLRERLGEALSDVERRRMLGQAARQKVEHTYSIKTVGISHLRMYQEMLAE